MILDRFTANASRAAATVVRVAALAAVPEALADYLACRGLEPSVALGDLLPDVPWESHPRLDARSRPLRTDGDALVTGCLAALAEEGAVVLVPTHGQETVPFLAATHIVLVQAGQLIESIDGLWSRLRSVYGPDRWPRATNIICGPSRTADLGVPSRLGAHGPVRLHIVVIGAS
jgi:L-lactate dehydrogenase complex protein LldG